MSIQKITNICLIGLAILIVSCSLDEINQYGEPCKGWAAIYSGGRLECSTTAGGNCKAEYLAAYEADYCPSKYDLCIWEANEKRKVCLAACPDMNRPVMCNGSCITKEESKNLATSIIDEDASSCSFTGKYACPDTCLEACQEDGSCHTSNVCEEGKTQCVGNKISTCTGGKWDDAMMCAVGQVCKDGKCTAEQTGCTAGERKCVLNMAMTCKDGNWEIEETCQDTCKSGTCVAYGAEIPVNTCETDTECKAPNEICQKGECINPCKDKSCENDEYCRLGECVPIDANHNHLHDMHESAPKLGSDCRKYADCDTSDGAGDGFCDSFIGYKCSTKCANDSQCLGDGELNYICRADGRCAPDSFVTVWEITDDSKTLTIPFNATECKLVTIDWGDDHIESYLNCSPLTHEYEQSGKYTVRIQGTFGPLTLSDDLPINDDRSKLIEVKAFGPVTLSDRAFYYCDQLRKVSTVDIPDSTKLQTLNSTFYGASNFNHNIENWDISNVTDLNSTFHDASSFNKPLDKWDTSKVQNMNNLFRSAKLFNQPIASWDTSNVIQMNYMFCNAKAFNQPIEDWNTSNVTEMEGMFTEASTFNQPLNKWDTSKVTRMNYMFSNASAFDSPLNQWDTSKVTDMSYMFSGASSFDQAIENWNTSKVENMTNMFTNASHFNQPLNKWDTSNVGAMTDMFFEATAFNQPLDNWNISKVVSIGSMFYNAKSFNQNINTWDTSSVENMSFLFFGASKFDKPLDSWNISKVKDTSYMFSGAEAFNQDINKWDTSNVTNMSNMFSNTAFNQSIEDWDTSNVTNMKAMFYSATQFNQPLDKWDTSKVTNMSNMFYNAKAFNQDLSSWKVNATISMMFDNSSLSKDNYCKIISSASWAKKPVMSQYTCDSQKP